MKGNLGTNNAIPVYRVGGILPPDEKSQSERRTTGTESTDGVVRSETQANVVRRELDVGNLQRDLQGDLQGLEDPPPCKP